MKKKNVAIPKTLKNIFCKDKLCCDLGYLNNFSRAASSRQWDNNQNKEGFASSSRLLKKLQKGGGEVEKEFKDIYSSKEVSAKNIAVLIEQHNTKAEQHDVMTFGKSKIANSFFDKKYHHSKSVGQIKKLSLNIKLDKLTPNQGDCNNDVEEIDNDELYLDVVGDEH